MVGALRARPVAAQTPIVGTQSPGFFRFHLGSFEITALNDGVVPYPSKVVLPTATSRQIARGLYAAGLTDPVGMSYNGFLINTGTKLVLIDVGTGGKLADNPGFRGAGRLLGNLRAAGYRPEQIDEIYISHFGPDHVGGLTQPSGITFPNARLRVSQAELAAFMGDGNLTGSDSTYRRFLDALFDPYRRAGHFEPFDRDTVLVPGIRSLATPGHTPGHTSFLVESEGATLLVLGDVIHLAALQFPRPDLPTVFDRDRSGGAKQRARVFRMAAEKDYWVAGAHLPFPGIGHIRANQGEGGYRWAPIEYPIPDLPVSGPH
jgi:glyoxylase-like metal-dependent hydrolase (beta-lactamase superfamily II)